MLGLERNVDALAPDDARDALGDAHLCLEDNFGGGQLDMARWESIVPAGMMVTVAQKLIFRFTVTAAADDPAIVRSQQRFDLTETVIEARLELRPSLTTQTTFAVTRMVGNDERPVYEMQIASDGMRLRVDGSEVAFVPLMGNFLRMRFAGDQVHFGSGNTAGTYSETASPANVPLGGSKVQLTALTKVAVGAPIEVHWANILVNCR